MMPQNLILWLFLGAIAFEIQAFEKIYYPRSEHNSDTRSDYPIKLLKAALANSKHSYSLHPSSVTYLQKRAIRELENPEGQIQILWTMTSIEREQRLLPIRIPILKGLIGWRIALMDFDDQLRFKNVKQVKDLKNFLAGQGHDWPDTAILKYNHLPVITAANYQGIFKMLEAKRFFYFPRSVAEIWQELQMHENSIPRQKIVVDEHIALHYDTALYFFVNKDNFKLAEEIKIGLENMIADGSFDILFNEHHQAFIKKSKLGSRNIIKLKNPLLPVDTPLDRPELWFSLEDLQNFK